MNEQREPTAGEDLFAVISIPLWIPALLIGALCGWISSAFLRGFHQGCDSWRIVLESVREPTETIVGDEKQK